jgi:serine/threonine protein kinase/Tol biopolymer transport system component
MTLTAGTRFGPYEVIKPLGTGGMGEVYRARDTRLNRDVAIKILPPGIADNPVRRARFEREAQAISRLNHPNICAVYDVGTQEGVAYLVMEYIEGESLAERLRRGPVPPVTALRWAIQIAGALDAAHRRGIVHRDMKPANVMVTGQLVKLLDFGLAKLSCEDSAAAGTAAALEPTISLTAERHFVGTLHYMAPEQLEGREIDPRTDLFAFGTLLYEMLTARKAFDGASEASVMAAILTAEPQPVSSSATPESVVLPGLDRVVRRALAKDPDERWQTARDLVNELQRILEDESRSTAAPAPSIGRAWRLALLAICAVAVLLGFAAHWLVGTFVWNSRSPAPASSTITRFSVMLDPGQFANDLFPMIAVSPDGKQIVYANDQGLYMRSMSELQALLIPGTENAAEGGASNPVFSPDGRAIAFFSGGSSFGGTIKRIAVAGGAAVSLLRMDFPPYGMTWGADGILFGRSFGQEQWGVYRLSPSGGPAELVIPENNEFIQGPQMLPDGHTVLLTVTAGTAADRWDKARIVAHSLKSSERKTLIDGGSDARYLPTGHIVFARNQTLLAVPFDAPRLQVIGKPVPVADEVSRSPTGAASGAGQFAVSGTGSLVYMTRPSRLWSLAEVDRNGTVRLLNLPPGPYQYPRLSGEGTRIVLSTDRGDEAIVWVGGRAGGGALRRLTFGGRNRFPIWSADGQRVTFQSDRDGDLGIFWQRADGTGSPERLTTALAGTSHVPESWSPAGDHMLFRVTQGSEFSLWTFSLKDRKAEPFGGVESSVPPNAVFSPDGRWVAYMSREADKFLISVQPFPATGTKYQVVEGGVFPLWSRDGREIFYFHGNGHFAVVNVLPQPGFTTGIPVNLWTEQATKVLMAGTVVHRGLDPTPDGFLSLIPASQDQFPAATQIQVVLNWFDELKQRVPVPH